MDAVNSLHTSWRLDFSVVEHLAVGSGTVTIDEGLQASVALRLHRARHKTHLVHFEHGLEQIGAARVQDALELVEARVIPEAAILQVRLIDLDGTALIAHHELLESEEAEVPTITFLVSDEMGDGGRALQLRANLELPNAAIDVGEAVERTPVLEMLGLVGGHGVHTNVVDHILVGDRVKDELGLVVSIEQVEQLGFLPDGVRSQQVVVLILVPVDIARREFVVLGHLERSLGLLVDVSGLLVGITFLDVVL